MKTEKEIKSFMKLIRKSIKYNKMALKDSRYSEHSAVIINLIEKDKEILARLKWVLS